MALKAFAREFKPLEVLTEEELEAFANGTPSSHWDDECFKMFTEAKDAIKNCDPDVRGELIAQMFTVGEAE